MVYTELESKKFCEMVLKSIPKVINSKLTLNSKIDQINLKLDILDHVLKETQKKKKIKKKIKSLKTTDTLSESSLTNA